MTSPAAISKSFLAICFVALVSFLSCDKGVGPDEQGRIVVNEGVDGVRFGDDAARVKQVLGEPTRIGYGDFPGVIFEYADGRLATMEIVVYEPTATSSGVVSFSVRSPYAGTTSEGVGVGDGRSFVLQKYGQPSLHRQNELIDWDRYEFGARLLIVYYQADVVESIEICVKL
jgi:hypothetical protein